jgi:subtilisin family serine protease
MPAAGAPVDADSSISAIGHCLLVAGIVLRVAPAARVKLVGVLDNDGTGSEATLAAALNKIAGQGGVQIVNLSLCTPELRLPAVESALERLHAQGVAVVAAAGNEIDDYPLTGPMLPAAFANVVGVGAMDGEDAVPAAVAQLAGFSQRGPWVDALTPGVQRFGSFVTGKAQYGTAPEKREFVGWCFWTGTSFAAPAVAGAAAAHLAAHPGMTGVDALQAVLDAGVQFTEPVDGVDAPIVDAPVMWPAPLPAIRTPVAAGGGQ